MEVTINQTKLELIGGDITEMDTEAIVNAANAQLVLGAGVAGAIRHKGGPSIQAECDRIGGTHVGGAVITGAGDLKARYVIHAVGPRQGEGDEDQKLAGATKQSLLRCEETGVKSIAFPAISTGVFGFPVDRAARIMLRTAVDHLRGETVLERVVFCLYGQETLAEFERALAELKP
ncbi:MAG: macro domain-containing protein [Proteobacteria bacterium]|nr:macro domain-containing protein [Pseudomonadota bacterium]